MANDNRSQSSSTVGSEYYRLGFMPFLEELSDEGFRNIKAKFVANKEKIVSIHLDRVTYELLKIFSAPDLLIEFDRVRFASVLNCFCPTSVLWSSHIERYVDELIAIVKEKKTDKPNQDDTKKDLEYLYELSDACKKSIENMQQYEVVQYLVDMYKFVTCLGRNKEEYGYRLQVDKSALYDTENRLLLRDEDMRAKAMSFSIAGSTGKNYIIEKNEQKMRYTRPEIAGRRHLFLLSWFLEELICDQDGIGEEPEVLGDE